MPNKLGIKTGARNIKIELLERSWLKPRLTDQSTLLAVRNSIEELGILALPTVSLKTGKVLSLHSVIEAALAVGEKDVMCWVVDLKPEQEFNAYLALNNHGNDWDWTKVSDSLKQLNFAKIPLASTGFCAAKIKALTHCGDWVPPVPPQLDGENAAQTGFTF